MKRHLYLFLALFFPLLGLAQDSQVEQLQKKVTALEQLIEEQQQKIDYFKEALDLRTKGLEATNGDIHIRINKVVGKASENKIYVQGLVTYRGIAKRNLQFSSHDLVSPNGSQFKILSTEVSNDPQSDFFVIDAEENIPYGFSMQVKDAGERIPTISLLKLRMYGDPAGEVAFSFKGLDVQWLD